MTPPILDIPNELLAKIFGHVLNGFPLRPADVNRIALVCRLWRDVVMSEATLWSHIDLDHPNWTEVCVKRSRDALLKVDTHRSLTCRSFHHLKPILAELGRMEHLGLTFDGPHVAGHIWDLLGACGDVPSLKSLSMKDSRRVVPGTLPLLKPTSLPPNLFCKSAHQLELLSLKGVNLPLSGMSFSALTDFAIGFVPRPQTWGYFVATLSGMPRLQRLDLAYFSPTSEPPSDTGVARLPELFELIVKDLNPKLCAAVLDAIEYPTNVCPTIICMGPITSTLAPLLRKCPFVCSGTPATMPIQQIHVCHSISRHGYEAVVNAWTKVTDGPVQGGLIFGLYANDLTSGEQRVGGLIEKRPVVLKNVCDHLDLSQLHTLLLNADYGLSFEYVPQLRNVRTLAICGFLLPLIKILEPHLPSPLVQGQGTSGSTFPVMPFPALHAIHFPKDSMTDEAAENLAIAIARRVKYGHKLHWLVAKAGSTSNAHRLLVEAQVEVLWLDRLDQPYPRSRVISVIGPPSTPPAPAHHSATVIPPSTLDLAVPDISSPVPSPTLTGPNAVESFASTSPMPSIPPSSWFALVRNEFALSFLSTLFVGWLFRTATQATALTTVLVLLSVLSPLTFLSLYYHIRGHPVKLISESSESQL